MPLIGGGVERGDEGGDKKHTIRLVYGDCHSISISIRIELNLCRYIIVVQAYVQECNAIQCVFHVE